MILIASIFYMLGILGGLYKFYCIVFIIFILSIIFIGYKYFKRYIKIFLRKKFICIIVMFFLIGFTHISFWEFKYEKIYDDIPKEVTIIGSIIKKQGEKDYKEIYKLRVKTINGNSKYKNINIYMSISKKNDLKYGDVVKVTGNFEYPDSERNEGGFSYKRYLKTKNIVGNIDASSIEKLGEEKSNLIAVSINNIKLQIEKNIKDMLDEKEAGLLIGILLGDKQYIENDINKSFQESNLSHLLAVSGAHVSYIIFGIIYGFSRFGRKNTKIITIIFLVFFIILTGATPSVLRAGIMAIYNILSWFVRRNGEIYEGMGISIFFILFQNPYYILDIGFMLSYLGTIGIISFYDIIYEKIRFKNKKIKNILAVSIAANIVIMPIMAIKFSKISVNFLISNLLSSPIFGIIIILGFISVIISFLMPPLAFITFFVEKIFIDVLIVISNFCEKLNFLSLYIKTPNIITIILFYLIIILVYKIIIIRKKEIKYRIEKFFLKTYKKIISLILLITFIFYFSGILNVKINLYINIIDVGQGDSSLIQIPKGKNILIDGGGTKDTEYNVGEKILLPYLLKKGVTKLDYCIISHFDSDHVEGILYLIGKITVENFIICQQIEDSDNYKTFQELLKKYKSKIIIVKKGDNIKIDKNSSIEILWPEEEQINENVLNNNSVVFKFNYYKFSMLFTGDIEKIAEEKILKQIDKRNLRSDILKVAHHGSKSSSTDNFIKSVEPKISVIGVGKNNMFGHPNNDVIARLVNIGSKIYRTDLNGEITIIVNINGNISIRTKIFE